MFAFFLKGKKRFFVIVTLLLFIITSIFYFYQLQRETHAQSNRRIYIYNYPTETFFDGGLIAIPYGQEPYIRVGGYNISGSLDVQVYAGITDELLLNYLIYDKDSKQLHPTFNVENLTLVGHFDTHVSDINDDTSKISLPLEFTGLYLVRLTYEDIVSDNIVAISNVGGIIKEAENEFIFWGQNMTTGKRLSEGSIRLLSLEEKVTELARIELDQNGLATSPYLAKTDVAVLTALNEVSVIPVNLQHLEYDFDPFGEKVAKSKNFVFTDRPIYQPGDTIYFKAIVRNDIDAVYTIPSGVATVSISRGWEEDVVFSQDVSINAFGGIDGSYTLPLDVRTGQYRLNMSLPEQVDRSYWSYTSEVWFSVENYTKPEFFVDVDVGTKEVVSGTPVKVSIHGQYFSGQPVTTATISYEVSRSSFSDYLLNYSSDTILNHHYGYGQSLTEGAVTLDENGYSSLELDTKLPSDATANYVYSVMVTMQDTFGNKSVRRKNVIVWNGEYRINRGETYSHSTQVNQPVTIPIKLEPIVETNTAAVNLETKLARLWWERDTEGKYNKQEEVLSESDITTNDEGAVTFSYTPSKEGSYTLTVTGKDLKNNSIQRTFYFYAYDSQGYFYNNSGFGFSIQLDKEEYLPTDTALVTFATEYPNRDALVTIERASARRYEVVSFTHENQLVYELPLETTDMPNVFVTISGFHSDDLLRSSKEIVVSTDSKRLNIDIETNALNYGPGEQVEVQLNATDSTGKPAQAEIALWAVDKAIFEVASDNNPEIFKQFWEKRFRDTATAHSLMGIRIRSAEQGAACFVQGTMVLMGDGTYKPIEMIEIGETVLTRPSETTAQLATARVTKTFQHEVSSYLVINDQLKLTPEHRLWVNNEWKEAGSIQQGEYVTDENGTYIMVSSIEWVRDQQLVYNLEIENHHTYFAGGVWVHNQKGSPRDNFSDLAYWNPTIRTNSDGKAVVRFTLPDNLTTWVVTAIGATVDTVVGQSKKEITVSKDVIVRPVVPNLLRVGDNIMLKAVVQNFTDVERTFTYSLAFTAGTVIEHSTKITLAPSETGTVTRDVRVNIADEAAELTYSLTDESDDSIGDVVKITIPTVDPGFRDLRALTGVNEASFPIALSSDGRNEQTAITLSLAPSLLRSMPTAINYLLDYPYGCMEQTTSRFAPLIIAKKYPDIFTDQLGNKDVDDMIVTGINRLSQHQKNEGGWTWWYSGDSDPFITMYILEYLLLAREAGIPDTDSMISRGANYLSHRVDGDANEIFIMQSYIAGLMGEPEMMGNLVSKDVISRVDNDFAALAVMSNVLRGQSDPDENGAITLAERAISQGNVVYWEAGASERFGSNIASTAFAVRALLAGNAGKDTVYRGIQYLSANRNNHYWSNTFATVQVIRAITDFSQLDAGLTPHYSYTVTLDDTKLVEESVSDLSQTIDDLIISVDLIKPEGSTLAVTVDGEGQLFSTLFVDEFRTDANLSVASNGLTVERNYINERGAGVPFELGDAMTIYLSITNHHNESVYASIEDHLPSGFVPINTNLLNEQSERQNSRWLPATDIDFTKDGAVLSLYRIPVGLSTYSYKARVLSEGTFSVPPAVAHFMYQPEINGRSLSLIARTNSLDSGLPFEVPVEDENLFVQLKDKVVDSRLLSIRNLLLYFLAAVGLNFLLMYKQDPETFDQGKRRLLSLLSKRSPEDQGNS